MIQIRVLGTLEVRGPDDHEVHRVVTQSKRAALLAYLAVANVGRHRRDVLVGIFWPEADQRRARNSLNQSLHVLRRAIGADAVVSRGSEEVGISETHVWCDARYFERAIEESRFADAVELYRGPFLEGLSVADAPAFEEWAREERERYARLYGGALESLAEAAEVEGRYGDAARWWRARAAEDPLSGRVTLRLMRALDAAGDRGAAIERAIAHEEVLYAELGAEPDPDVAAYARKLRDAPVTREAVPGPLPTNGPPSAPVAEAEWPWRRAIVNTITVGLALATVVAALMCLGEELEIDPRRVVAAPFENRTPDPSLDAIGPMAADWITQELARTGLVRVVPSVVTLRSARALAEETTGSEYALTLARQTGAGLVVTGSYARLGDSLVFQAQVVDPSTGELVRAIERVAGPAEFPLQGVDSLRARVVGALSTVLDDRLRRWATTASQPPSFEAYRAYTDGLDLFFRRAYARAAERLEEAAAMAPGFTAPLVWASYAHGNAGDWERAGSVNERLHAMRDRLSPWDRAIADMLWADRNGDRRGAYLAAKRVAALAPGSEWNYVYGFQSLKDNRPREAIRALDAIDPERGWIQEWASYWSVLGDALHLAGDHEREMQVARRTRELFPERDDGWMMEITALVGLGRVDEAADRVDAYAAERGVLEWPLEILADELRAHGHPEEADRAARRGLAALAALPAESRALEHNLWRAYRFHGLLGDLGAMEETLDEIRDRFADDSITMIAVRAEAGVLSARRGDAATARAMIEWLDDLRPLRGFSRGRPHVDQARIAARLGDVRGAVRYLQRAYRAGYMWPLEHHARMDFEPLRGDPAYEAFVRPKG